ncbi:MAG: sugar transferase [Clostridia bacterium]|nr:sugar transferase [Clostridia bacterium]
MKRVLDVIFSIAAIVILSPLLLLLSAAVLIADGAPVIFRQERIGRGGKRFLICKFRTMKKGVGNVSKKDLQDYESCLIRCGSFLRRTSLDELPQLFNILGGTMSFVGPRPLIPEESEIDEMRSAAGVYSVRPGVTGLAQVSGRDNLSNEEKTAYDSEYVRTQSLRLDLKILCKTVGVVLRRENMTQDSGK